MIKKTTSRQELGKRRILFSREETKPKMFKEDIMLALNKTLWKMEEQMLVHFNQVSYLQFSSFYKKKRYN